MPKTRVRAALACRIVGLDRVKFNEAVANRAYGCAPSTAPGSARLFEAEDLLPLFFFARLLEMNLSVADAGRGACEAARTAGDREGRAAHAVVLLRSQHRPAIFVPVDENYRTYGDDPMLPFDANFRATGQPHIAMVFPFATIRKLIAERIKEERNTLGEPDDGDEQ